MYQRRHAGARSQEKGILKAVAIGLMAWAQQLRRVTAAPAKVAGPDALMPVLTADMKGREGAGCA